MGENQRRHEIPVFTPALRALAAPVFTPMYRTAFFILTCVTRVKSTPLSATMNRPGSIHSWDKRTEKSMTARGYDPRWYGTKSWLHP